MIQKLLTIIVVITATASFSEEASWEIVFDDERPYFCALKLPEEFQQKDQHTLIMYLDFHNQPKMFYGVGMAGEKALQAFSLTFMNQAKHRGAYDNGMKYTFVQTLPSGKLAIVELENYNENLPTTSFNMNTWPSDASNLKFQGSCEQPPESLFN